MATEKQGKRNFGKDGRNKKKNTGNYADFTPAQGLAMSTELDCKAFEQVETDYANAIKYLRGETLTPERQYQRGYVLVTYRGVPLGFANNVGTRLNNAYPQAYEALMRPIPRQCLICKQTHARILRRNAP